MPKSPFSARKILSPIHILIIVNMLIGGFLLGGYGDSWDEFKFYKYANLILDSLEWFTEGELPTFGNTYDNYGPVYVAGITLITRLVEKTGLAWAVSHVRHFIYFLTFQIGIFAFYRLSLRWMGAWAAFGATLLFSTQPLFWGHAFISPKDIPVLSFFTLSLYLGFRMVDVVFGNRFEDAGSFEALADHWDELPRRKKRNFRIFMVLGLLLVGILVFGSQPIHSFISTLIYRIYDSERPGLAGRLFAAIAEDAFSAEAAIYIGKALLFFQQTRFFLLLLSPMPVLGYLWKVFGVSLKKVFPAVLLAGVVLGLATSIRILAPLAGMLVGIFMFRKAGLKSLPILAVYAMVALYVLYLTWPYLWPDPSGRLIESIGVMSQYPWEGKALFNGVYYPPTDLPWTYLPVLLAIQFTEPVWVLFTVGFVASIWMWRKQKNGATTQFHPERNGGSVLRFRSSAQDAPAVKSQGEQVQNAADLLWLSLGWFVLPVLGLIMVGAPLYDNSRQVFFLLPPIFLIAGMTLELFFRKLRHPIIKTLIIIGVVLPGIIQGIRLHPYQYIYYNSLIGGVSGAYRQFELDYWGISYLEAAKYLNEIAPPNARVWAAGPSHLLPIREDMSIYSLDQEFRADSYDYVVALTRYDLDLTTFPEAESLHEISKDGAVLTVVKGAAQP